MIPVCGTKIWGNELKYLSECVETGWFSSLGKFVGQFENEFKKVIGTNYALACSNGTAGLFAALKGLDIGEGDEVIIPDFTIVVSANVVIMTGAKPVLVDVEKDTWCIDPKLIEAKITPKTKAIMIVHMYGHPADMDAINAIAKKHNLYVIEDCCQSHGATYKGKMTGTLSDVSVFSFYANKILTTGEGGLILSDNEALMKKIKLFMDNGFEVPRFKHRIVGFNFRLSNLQAAVGLAQTEHLADAVNRKREIARRYLGKFEAYREYMDLPVEHPDVKNVYWMFGVVLKPKFGRSKEEVMTELRNRGIETRSFFYGMHEQPVFQTKVESNYPDVDGAYPVSKHIGNHGFYLPTGLELADKTIDEIADQLISLIKK